MNENNNLAPHAHKRGKGRKFNVIDVLLIVAVVLVVAALVYVFLPSSLIKNLTADETKAIQYTVEFVGVDEAFLNNIQIDQVIYDSVSKSEMGKVYAVDYSHPYEELTYDENNNGVGILTPVEGKYNIQVTITATAQYKSGEGYTVGGTRIAVGEKLFAKFPNFVGEGYCIGLVV